MEYFHMQITYDHCPIIFHVPQSQLLICRSIAVRRFILRSLFTSRRNPPTHNQYLPVLFVTAKRTTRRNYLIYSFSMAYLPSYYIHFKLVLFIYLSIFFFSTCLIRRFRFLSLYLTSPFYIVFSLQTQL